MGQIIFFELQSPMHIASRLETPHVSFPAPAASPLTVPTPMRSPVKDPGPVDTVYKRHQRFRMCKTHIQITFGKQLIVFHKRRTRGNGTAFNSEYNQNSVTSIYLSFSFSVFVNFTKVALPRNKSAKPSNHSTTVITPSARGSKPISKSSSSSLKRYKSK